MPTWKFAPTSRNVAADTSDLAFDLGVNIIDDLPLTVSNSTTVKYEGSLSIVSPSAIFVLTLKGQNFSTLDGVVTGGTINQLSLTIAGGAHVTITGLNVSAERFGELAVVDFDSTVLLEQLLLSGNDNITGTGLDDNLNGMAGRDQLFGGAGVDDLYGGAANDRLVGAAGQDDLFGGAGNDVLIGGTGDDFMTGGGGADKFVFDLSVFASGTNFIEDFGRTDVIVLDNDGFKGIGGPGKMSASVFKNLDTGTVDANDRILYSQSGGGLFYDADGSGFKKFPVLFLSLDDNPRLTAADFMIMQ
jgi:Ca2+-binding RTX toxin-like protein